MIKLEKIELSCNNLTAIPTEISCLIALTDINLDNNDIVALPKSIGQSTKLKTLSSKHNQLRRTSVTGTHDDKKDHNHSRMHSQSTSICIEIP